MLTPVHPRFIPPPYQDAPDRGRLILRDGSAADLRPATPADCPALTNLFLRLSAESHYQRFHTLSTPSPDLIARLCSAPDPKVAITLVATRTQADEPRIIATGTYVARDENTAEVALVVEDTFQGKGLGTLLLERLALLAAQNGFANFWALTSSANRAMLDVFRTSGFVVRERAEGTDIELTLSVTPTEASVSGLELRDRIATVASLLPLFKPRSVAVVGASRETAAIGFRILDALVKEGFAGPIYPVNPKASTIAGVKAYPSVSAIPGPVDLAVISVPSAAVLGVVDDCAARGVRALVVITAGFAEVGRAGVELQHHLLAKVRGHGMRMVGPNCLGILNADPAVRLNASFSPIFPESGRIAMSSQSGAVGLAALGFARRYGLGFSTFVSVGNKADVSGNDLLQYWEEDTGTGVILLYLESFGNPRRFSRIARRVGRRKPVVVLFSGRTAAGSRAAGSHTAA
ncbi:MAG TPA: GNAT family N-acetyltransferase, partial [Gemmata sp.]|nr:GNAT family N-acetyltransferase [Gemmata sp.]